MKKTILFAILLSISTGVLSYVVIPELPTSDVEGSEDDVGVFEYNMNLSQKRAQSVVDELSAKYGISQEHLVPVGVSYASPVSPNETEEGRALNGRVELVKNRAQ